MGDRNATYGLSLLLLVGCMKRETPAAQLDAAPSSAPAATTTTAPPPPAPIDPTVPRVTLPGTGVSLVPPPGVHTNPVGTTLNDDEGKILVSVAIGKRTPEHDSTWLAMWPSPPEPVSIGALTGTLRHRRRDRDGGEFDAWVLIVKSDELSLVLMMTDKGSETDRWKKWRGNVLSADWNPKEVDVERALGVSAGAIQGMHMEKDAAGGLMYRAEPPDSERITLLLSAMPYVLPEAPETCFELLRKSVATTKATTSGKPVAFRQQSGFRGCEIESTEPGGKSIYWAAVAAPESGGLIIILGNAPTPDFGVWRPRYAAAARGLRLTR